METNSTRSKKTGTSRRKLKLEAEVTDDTRDVFKEFETEGSLWYQKISDRFTSGIPDYIFCFYGEFGGVELKREGLKQKAHAWPDFALGRPLQAYTLHKIRKAGGHALATDNAEDVRRLLLSIRARHLMP